MDSHQGFVLWFTGLSGRENPRLPSLWSRSSKSAVTGSNCWTGTRFGRTFPKGWASARRIGIPTSSGLGGSLAFWPATA